MRRGRPGQETFKAWSDDYYQEVCKGRLKPVLDTIGYMKRLGIWVEVTTLVIPYRRVFHGTTQTTRLPGALGYQAIISPVFDLHVN